MWIHPLIHFPLKFFAFWPLGCSDPWGGPCPPQGVHQESCLSAALSQACPPFTPLGSLVWGAEGKLGLCVQPGKPCFAVRYTEFGLGCDPGTGTPLNRP